MINHASPTFTLRDVARIAFRFRLRAILLFVSILALTVAYITMAPREYASEARIFVRLGRESVALDPTASLSPTVSINETRNSEINSVVEILNSRSLAAEIVDILGPEMILEPVTIAVEGEAEPAQQASASPLAFLEKPKAAVFGFLTSIHLVDPVDVRDRAIAKFMQSLAIEVGKHSTGTRTGSNVITLGYSSHTPEQAQLILTTLMDAYGDKHAEVHRTSGSLEFFVEQSALLSSDLQTRTEELRDMKSDRDLTSIGLRREALESQRLDTESRIRRTEADLAASQAQTTALQATLEVTPERIVTDSVGGLPNQAADSMRDTLYQLQIREHELASKYSADHPEVIAVRRQVAEALAIMGEQETERVQETTALNPTYQPLELQYLREKANAESLSASLSSLQTQHASLLAELRELNSSEVLVNQLQREVELLETSYREYAVNLEQARIEQALETDRISNINVVQAASISSDPIRPSKGVVLVLGMFLATAASVGLVLISYRLDQSFQTPDQLDRAIDVPVWGSIAYHARSVVPLP